MEASENKQKMLRGELYVSFTPELMAERTRCTRACQRYNDAREASRRELVTLWRDVVGDTRPLPPKLPDAEADTEQFWEDAWVDPPIRMDYGYNVKLGVGVYVNVNAVFIDTCTISVGARTMFGPHVSVYSGTHPLDPLVRNGLKGPENGKPVTIGEDCWIGGNATILPGVTIGRGCTVGAGSVVTKDVPPFHVVAGNPARILRKIETAMDPEQNIKGEEGDKQGAEVPMATLQ